MDALWISCGKVVRQKILSAAFANILARRATQTLSSRAASLVCRGAIRRISLATRVHRNITKATRMAAIATGDLLAQEWFDLLDQRRFDVEHECWTAQVFGVHVAGAEAWIQLEFAEDRRRSLLLHVTALTGISAAVEAIRAALRPRA